MKAFDVLALEALEQYLLQVLRSARERESVCERERESERESVCVSERE